MEVQINNTCDGSVDEIISENCDNTTETDRYCFLLCNRMSIIGLGIFFYLFSFEDYHFYQSETSTGGKRIRLQLDCHENIFQGSREDMFNRLLNHFERSSMIKLNLFYYENDTFHCMSNIEDGHQNIMAYRAVFYDPQSQFCGIIARLNADGSNEFMIPKSDYDKMDMDSVFRLLEGKSNNKVQA